MKDLLKLVPCPSLSHLAFAFVFLWFCLVLNVVQIGQRKNSKDGGSGSDVEGQSNNNEEEEGQ